MLLQTPTCEIGWQAANFELPDADGSRYKLMDFLGKSPLMVAFICNHCPYVQAIAARLADDADTLRGEGIKVLAIMSNDYHSVPADSPEHMKRFADFYGFHFPYLVDEDQSVARAYGAVCTPDFFGFNAEGALQYRGRLDDAGRMGAGRRNRELVDAMRLIAKTGKGPAEQYPSMGCSIKWRD